MTKMLGSLDKALSSWESEILPDLQHKARSIQSLKNELATTQSEVTWSTKFTQPS